ncbi:MAG: hypothetical protein LHV68_09765 [Elusimicrobia bacterium]|nr:hypothetical protein [Candidatus Liberimonas magnetica]
MREELQKLIDSSNYSDDYDLYRTLWIAKNLHKGRFELALKHQKDAEKEVKTEEELLEYCDDIHYYAYQESHFIWHFCLWRLQAVLEGIISVKYLQSKNVIHGLTNKLKTMLEMGYTIDPVDNNQLLEWSKLRNQLSHSPPSSHSPGPLEESDLDEYYALCKRLCENWDIQFTKVHNKRKT